MPVDYLYRDFNPPQVSLSAATGVQLKSLPVMVVPSLGSVGIAHDVGGSIIESDGVPRSC
jgi:hypothetical protein